MPVEVDILDLGLDRPSPTRSERALVSSTTTRPTSCAFLLTGVSRINTGDWRLAGIFPVHGSYQGALVRDES